MNEDLFKGKWHQFKGKVREKWGKLTDDDIMRINGKKEQLLGMLQKKYGWAQQQAEEEFKRFEKTLGESSETSKGYSEKFHKEEGHSKRDEKNPGKGSETSKGSSEKFRKEEGPFKRNEKNNDEDKFRKRKAG